MRQARSSERWKVVRLVFCLAAMGCGDGGAGSNAPAANSFESDVPASLANQGHDESALGGPTRGSADAAAVPTTPGSSASPAAGGQNAAAMSPAGKAGNFDSSGEAARAISEADVIQVQGDVLYALSRIAGLAVIDVQDPTHLKLLGRYRELPAEPFELYVRDQVALVMFTGWGEYKRTDDGDYTYVSTSKLLALDVHDPANVAKLGDFDVAGTISDSRMVGDVLYIVTYENGYCWGCQSNKPRTRISSLNVSDPKHVQPIDELAYADTDNNYGGGPKSITVTAQRMYVSGPEYSQDGPIGSTVQVVDISDPSGDLVEGTSVQVAGQVMSRWQMDEFDNVLRVISQPQQKWTAQGTVFAQPAVETFRVESSKKLSALGKTNIQLPMDRETLRSARFDGTRAYLITAEQKDPLFTIDLSDPAHPKQLASVEMPGFVWHMEPRGDRLLGVGFDNNNKAGGLTVSLFDVKDLSQPQLLSRVNFGGSWGSLPADQDRAHKVFRVFDEAGLILVPFSGWDYGTTDQGGYYCGRYSGGVEIIDFKNDKLTARGAAPSTGEARRAFLQHDHLVSVSDERVEAFDITNRDQPQLASNVVLARQVNQAVQLDNDIVARISYDGRTGQPRIDFVGASKAGEADQSLGELSFDAVAGGQPTSQCAKSVSLQQALARGSELDLVYETYTSDARGQGTQTRGVLVVDASDPSAPTIKSDTYWSDPEYWQLYAGYYSYGYYNSSPQIVRTENTISVLESLYKYNDKTMTSSVDVRMRVIDLRDSSHVSYKVLPVQTATSFSGLLADGDTVLTSHLVNGDTGRARFYIDRFDVSDPSNPRQLPSVNVPGALLSFDRASGRAITSEQKRTLLKEATYEECGARFAYFEWNSYTTNNAPTVGVAIAAPAPSSGGAAKSDGSAGTPPDVMPVVYRGDCVGFTQSLHLVKLQDDVATLEDTITLDEKKQLMNASTGDGVFFGSIGRGYYAVGPAIDCFGPCGGPSAEPPPPSELLVLGSFGSGKFEVGHIRVDQKDPNAWWGFWGTPPVYAWGQRAIMVGQSDVAIIDATTPSAPTISKRVDLIASVQSVDIRDGNALLVLGAQGVQWLSLK